MRYAPAVTVSTNTEGMFFDDSLDTLVGTEPNYDVPADPSIAVGPTRMMQIVNNNLRILDKQGFTISETSVFEFFFPAATAGSTRTNAKVLYDDTAGRFYVFTLQQTGGVSQVLMAVSDTSTPTNLLATTTIFGPQPSDFTEVQTIPTGGATANNFKAGYNREGLFLTADLFAGGLYNSTALMAINKASILDQNAATFTGFSYVMDSLNPGMAPAVMHGAPAGSPMYFVGTYGIGNNGTPASTSAIRVTRMTNPVSATPRFDFTQFQVGNYGNGPLPLAAQPGDVLNVGDTRIVNAAWRNNRLVATHTASIGNEATARWYEFDTRNRKPGLVQTGNIDPGGRGVYTYFPAIEVSQKGDIGIVYVQSSATQFMSVYLTGRQPTDPKASLQTPVLLKSGVATYVDTTGAPYSPGSYSGIAVDPASPNSFWAVGEWSVNTRASNNWSTWFAHFWVSPLTASPIKLNNPLRWVYDRATDTFNGSLTLVNAGDIVTGRFQIVITIPDPAIQILSPIGFRVNNQYYVTINGTFNPFEVLRIPYSLRNPNNVPMGSFNIGFISGLI